MLESLQLIFPLFEKELIEDIIENGSIKHYVADDHIMKTGQYFRSALLVTKGLIKVYREDESGNEFFMYYLQPGHACALSMVCAERSEQSKIMAKTVCDSTVISIPLSYTEKWMLKYKSWYHFVVNTYRNMIDDLLLTVDDIAFNNMDHRLSHYLRREQEVHHSSIITVNHTEVAEELNSSREVISRLMKKMSDRGMVKLYKNQQVELINLGAKKESC
jgi:CRP/FNR family transcriptional regulator, anaerobic regulatory protein